MINEFSTFLLNLSPVEDAYRSQTPIEDFIDPSYLPVSRSSRLRLLMFEPTHPREDAVFRSLVMRKVVAATSFNSLLSHFGKHTFHGTDVLLRNMLQHAKPAFTDAETGSMVTGYSLRAEPNVDNTYKSYVVDIQVKEDEVATRDNTVIAGVRSFSRDDSDSLGPFVVTVDQHLVVTLPNVTGNFRLQFSYVPLDVLSIIAGKLSNSYISRDDVAGAGEFLTQPELNELIDTVNDHPISSNVVAAAAILLALDTKSHYVSTIRTTG